MKRNHHYLLVLSLFLMAFNISLIAGGGGGGLPPAGTSLACGGSSTFNLDATGFTGSNPTAGDAGCNPCCYAGADLDGDGLQDVPFSVENSEWFQYCNSTGSPMTIDFVADETGTGSSCNIQGAVWVGATLDATTMDCGNAGYQYFDSNPGGAADGFTFTVTVPPGECAFMMVDGYGGATCNPVTVSVICPCTPPTTANAGPDQTVCATTATLAGNTITTGTGVWTLVSGSGTITTPTSPTSGVTGLGVGANVFQWTSSNAPCPSTSDQVTITRVAPPTVANAGPDQTVCVPTATLAGNTAVIGTGTWTLISGSGTITTPSSPTSGVTALGVGANVFQWTISNNPCPATSDQVTITGVAAPTVAAAGPDQTVCATTATLAGNTATVGTGTWTLVSGSGTITTPGSPTSGVTALGVGANVFQWTISNAPCPSTTDQVTITRVSPPTVANAGPDQTVCATSATLAGNTAVTGTGTWTLISGSGTITTPSSPTSGVTALGVGANVFQWTISNNPCPATTDQVTITGVAAPTVAAAGPDQTVCATTATLAGNTAVTGTGTWTLISGSGTITTPSSPTSGVTALGVGANVFQWTISNAPCPSTTDQVTITRVSPPTVAAAGPDQTVCGTTATLAGNTAVTGTGTWTLISGSGTITTPSSPTSGITGLGVGANVFQWTISNNPCPATTDQVTITGVAAPTVAAAGPDQTVCGTTATLAGNTAVAGTGTWTLISGSGTITTPSSPTSGITGLGVGANVFQWTIANAPCPSTTDQVTITGVAAPTVAAAGPDQTVCGTTATLAGNTAVTGTGTWTLISGSGTITTPSSPTSGITGLGVGANVFQWTIANAPCPSTTDQVTITGVATPTVAAAGPDQTVCGTTATLAGNTAVAGTGTWTLISGSGTITTPSSPTSGITGLGVGANVFQWTIANAPCPSTTDQVTITGVAAPTVAAAGPDQTICGTTATLAGNTAVTGTGTWTLISGSGTITTPSSPTSGITGLGVGANVFQWTIANAPCPSTTDQVTITGVANPTVANAGPDQTLCGTTATLAGNTAVTGTGTWTLISGSGTITTPSSPTSGLTGLAVGVNIFQWTITNAPCPSTSDQVSITVTSTPTAAAAGPDQTVCGTTATLAGNAPGAGVGAWTLISGSGTITTPSSPTSGVTGLGVGANVFQWTITSAPCTPSSDQVTITGVATPTVASAGPDQTVCGTTATLAGNTAIAGTGTWTLISGSGTITTPSSPTSGITGLGVGANVFQWTIANAPCPSTTDQVTITGVAAPTVATAGPDQTICGTTATLAGNTASIGTGTWTLISGSGTITTPSSETSGITGLGVGANVFQWTIANAPCPSTTDQVTITGVASPTTAVAGPDQSICVSTATLAGNTAVTGTGTWTLISGSGTITTPSSPTSGVTGLAIGANIFEWTISNAPCAASSDQVTITMNAPDDASFTYSSSTYCQSGTDPSPTITGLAGGTFSSTAGITLNPATGTITLISSTLGTYTVTYTTNGPCPSTATFNITITLAPSASFSYAGPYCQDSGADPFPTFGAGASAGVFSSSAGLTIDPSTGQITLSTSTPGTYTVANDIAASGGCAPSSATATVVIDPFATADAGVDDTICAGSTFTTIGTVGGSAGSSVWTTSGSGTFSGSVYTPSPADITAGSVTLTITTDDPAGACSAVSDAITLTIDPLPVADAGAMQTLACASSSATLTGSSSVGGANFSWSGPGVVSGGTTATPTVNLPGVYTLTVSIAGCSTTDTVSVLSNTSAPNADAGSVQTLTCAATSVILNGSSSTGGVTFNWTGGTIVSGGTTATPTVSTPGIYTITVTDPSNGCNSTDTVSVLDNSVLPNADAGTVQMINCIASTVTLNGSSTTAGATYSWAGSGIISGGTTATPTANAVGTYTITVTDPSNSCTSTDTVSVLSNTTPPDANAGAAQTITCTTSSVILNGSSVTSGATFSWAGAGIVSGGTTATPTVNAGGTYTVTVTDPVNGCTSTSTVIVSSNTTTPVADAGTLQNIGCGVSTAILDGSGSGSGANIIYNWTTAGGNIVSGGTSTSPVVDLGGVYTITVTDTSNGCTSTDTVSVISSPTPVASFSATPVSGTPPLTVSFTNSSSNSNTYSWDFGNGNNSTATSPGDIYNAPGTYTVTLIASFNSQCPDTTFATIVVYDNFSLFVPNTFSPNNDGNNDVFYLTSTGVAEFYGEIYDRWGLKLFEMADVSTSWDGRTSAGLIAPDGTYYYIFKAKGQDGSEQTFTGFIMLFR